MNQPDTPHLSIPEVALRLGTTQKAVRRMIASGELPAHRPGGKLAVPADELDRALTVAPASRATLFGPERIRPKEPRKGRYATFPSPRTWADVAQHWASPPAHALPFLDVFSGAGGLSLGLELAGWKGVAGQTITPRPCAPITATFGTPPCKATFAQPKPSGKCTKPCTVHLATGL